MARHKQKQRAKSRSVISGGAGTNLTLADIRRLPGQFRPPTGPEINEIARLRVKKAKAAFPATGKTLTLTEAKKQIRAAVKKAIAARRK